MKKLIAAALMALALPVSPALAEATAAPVSYKDGDTELEGFWVNSSCTARENTPLVLVIHQWKGISAHEKETAEKLGKLCNNVLVVDMYGKGIRPQTNEAAGTEATKYKSDSALAHSRLKAALDFAQGKAQSDKVAVMGYCFGGTMALEAARMGADIDGAISFHGGLSTPSPVTDKGIIKASILVHHGDIDPLVPDTEVASFQQEMRDGGADMIFTRYSGAVHAFTHKDAGDDISQGFAYNQKADERSWQATVDFLNEKFGSTKTAQE